MAKIRKRKIRWSPSPSPDVVGYRLYWAKQDQVNYQSESVSLGRRTAVILPDDLPSFPLTNEGLELGVSALTEIGNESDITTMSSPIGFGAPEPPGEPVLETLPEYFVTHDESSD